MRGRKTTAVVRNPAITGMAIWRVPATSGSASPRARAVSMASSTTIELSTSMPAARARPASDTTSSDSPAM